MTVEEVVSGIGPRIPNGKYVRAMYGAITKPPQNGGVLEDMERITLDADLPNFIEVTSGAYKPIIVQMQIITDRDEGQQTPPPDNQPYFGKQAFDTKTGRDDYDPAVSDSENELYLIKFDKRKARALPRSDHGFEHQKAKCRMCFIRMWKHLEEVKRRHKKFMGPRKAQIVDSDDEAGFSWLKWLNPQDGKSNVRARASGGLVQEQMPRLLIVSGTKIKKLQKRLHWLLLVRGIEEILICGRITMSRRPIPLLQQPLMPLVALVPLIRVVPLMALLPLCPLVPLLPLLPLVPLIHLLPPMPLPSLWTSYPTQHKGVIFRFCLQFFYHCFVYSSMFCSLSIFWYPLCNVAR